MINMFTLNCRLLIDTLIDRGGGQLHESKDQRSPRGVNKPLRLSLSFLVKISCTHRWSSRLDVIGPKIHLWSAGTHGDDLR